MEERGIVTPMVHYVCHTCGVSATCVLNSVAELAWLDHMTTHHLEENYSAYYWDVMQLPLGVRPTQTASSS